MPVVAEEAGEVGCDLALAATREPHLRYLLEAGVGSRACSASMVIRSVIAIGW